MSIPDTGSSKGSVKTLAIRLEPDLHQQLSLIAQLGGSTITDEIRTAIKAHLSLMRANPELASKADSALDDIERDAAARREAIASLFSSSDNAATGSRRTRGRKPAGQAQPEG
jgi:predicted DNA-binding protein